MFTTNLRTVLGNSFINIGIHLIRKNKDESLLTRRIVRIIIDNKNNQLHLLK